MHFEIMRVIMKELPEEKRATLVKEMLRYTKVEDVQTEVISELKSRIDWLINEMKEIKPHGDPKVELAKVMALKKLDSSWDEEYNSIEKVRLTKRTLEGYEIWIEYADSDDCLAEIDYFISRKDVDEVYKQIKR